MDNYNPNKTAIYLIVVDGITKFGITRNLSTRMSDYRLKHKSFTLIEKWNFSLNRQAREIESAVIRKLSEFCEDGTSEYTYLYPDMVKNVIGFEVEQYFELHNNE